MAEKNTIKDIIESVPVDPFYVDADGVIFCSDCLDLMKHIPDKSVDLVLTDPPYGIGIANNPFRQKHKKSDWDDAPMGAGQTRELLRVGREQIIWGGNYFNLRPSQGFLVWDKCQPFTFSSAMVEMAWCSRQSPAKMFRQRVTEYEKMHPTQKPLNLMVWCIEHNSSPSDLILDPFLGSGTTAVAAKMLGRKYIGIEISEEYCAIAKKRLIAVDTGVPVKEADNGQKSLFEVKHD